MSIVLCFSGGIASGKTSLASAAADRICMPSASFGRFVRSTAQARGVSPERASLQTLGESLIAEWGWDGFCRGVLEAGGWTSGRGIVVDGIRHELALTTVRSLVAPVVTKLVFVEVPVDVRERRSLNRLDDTTDLATAEKHSTEHDVAHVLRRIADLIVDGTHDVSALIDELTRAFGL